MMLLNKLLQSGEGIDVIPSANGLDGGLFSGDLGFSIFFARLMAGDLGPLAGVFSVLGVIWLTYSILAYIAAIVLLGLYVFATVNKKQYEDLETQALRDEEQLYAEKFFGAQKNSRLTDILRHVDSNNPNDWKLAIIEADIILDDILKSRGYPGGSLGERLKSIGSGQLGSLNDAWEAHKVRNRIAHDGADFVLTKRIAQETIQRYQRVFAEFGLF
jgi:nitrogen fixation-related uncharacterized protein